MKHDQKRDEDDEGLDDVLAQIPDRFIIAEEELDGAVHAAYSRFVQRLTSCQPQAAGLEARRTLFDPTASFEVKQEMLARLAQCGTVGAYRAISESSQQGSAECSIACGILWPLASRARHCTTRSDAVWSRHGARYASGTIPSWNRSAFTQTMSSSRLVSMETPVGTVVDEGIAAANGDDPLLRRDYFVTNVTVPTEEEIRRVLEEISRDEPPR